MHRNRALPKSLCTNPEPDAQGALELRDGDDVTEAPASEQLLDGAAVQPSLRAHLDERPALEGGSEVAGQGVDGDDLDGRAVGEVSGAELGGGVDGGRLYIGVRERKQGEPPEVPLVDLDGLRERVDQVARSVPQPPLTVRCLELRDDGDPARGVLVVEVPPSADAPHMVDGRYPARADTTSYWMADAEVRDIIARRALVAAGIEQLLDAEIDRDPTPPELRQFGHLFVVAQPVAGRPEMLHEKIDANGFSHWFSSVQFARENVRWDPDVNGLPHRDRRAGGWAAHSYEIGPDRQVRPNGDRPAQERNLLDIEVHEDGGIRLFCGRATDETRNSGQVVIIDALVAGLVGRVVSLARAVADTTAYHGTWHLAVAATNLRGASASSRARSFAFDDGTPYSADEYRKTYSPSYAELEEPAILLGRLVAPLLRSISSPLDINDVV